MLKLIRKKLTSTAILTVVVIYFYQNFNHKQYLLKNVRSMIPISYPNVNSTRYMVNHLQIIRNENSSFYMLSAVVMQDHIDGNVSFAAINTWQRIQKVANRLKKRQKSPKGIYRCCFRLYNGSVF